MEWLLTVKRYLESTKMKRSPDERYTQTQRNIMDKSALISHFCIENHEIQNGRRLLKVLKYSVEYTETFSQNSKFQHS